VSNLSDYLNAHLPEGWQKPQLVDALSGQLDRATVYKYLAGSHPQNPQDNVLRAFASVLPGVTVVQLRAAAHQPVGVEQPWVPPVEANRLTMPQRRALEAFIKATVAAAELVPADAAATMAPTPMAPAPMAPAPMAPAPVAPAAAAGATVPSWTEPGIPDDVSVLVTAVAGQLSADERAEVQNYIDQLNASGRTDLAERVAASLVINSASETASRSSRD
jgi:hypothetical protein